MTHKVTLLFPFWAILFSAAAYCEPGFFAAMKPGIVPLLGLVMFGMGMTLGTEHFSSVLQRPSLLVLGVFLQYSLMPLFAWVIAGAFRLPPHLAAGMVLVGCSPGGTASNVVCYLARGNLALSIVLTSCSTVLAFIATPLLSWMYIGKSVPVPVFNMLVSVLKIIILPVGLGVLINTLWGRALKECKKYFPLLSVFSIVLIIAIIVGLNRDEIRGVAPRIFFCVVLHNALGLAGGYWVARGLGVGEKESRTLAIEVGMQNSGLSVALAVKYFSAITALPGAVFSIWHNLSGSCLAAYWSGRKSGITSSGGSEGRFR